MSSLLEKYLREVAVQLHELPEDEREEQVEEIRAHLETYIEQQNAAGATGDEAVREAITQFGPPAKVGRDIMRARYRLVRSRLWLILAASFAFAAGVLYLTGSYFVTNYERRPEVVVVVQAAETVLIGFGCGLLLRKLAVRLVAWFYVIAGVPSVITSLLSTAHVHHLALASTGMNITLLLLGYTVRLLAGTGGAWIGARVAEKLIRRRSVQPAR